MPVFAVSMATEFTAVDLEVARTVRADIEQRGGYSKPYGEFRKRIAAAGISLNSTARSKLRTGKLLLGQRLEAGQRRKPMKVLLLS